MPLTLARGEQAFGGPRVITVRYPSGAERQFPEGTLAAVAAADPEFPRPPVPLIGVLVGNELTSLACPLSVSCELHPVDLGSRAGLSVYRRSLCFLLSLAARQVFPDRRLVIGHSLGHGYFWWFDGVDRVPAAELAALERRMRELASQDLPIRCGLLAHAEAVERFERGNQPDAVLLLRGRNEPQVRVHECAGVLDLDHGPLAPSTGLLSAFGLAGLEQGFLLRYPPAETPLELGPLEHNPVLFAVYREHKNWGKILRVTSAGRLNRLVRDGGVREFIQVAEALHERTLGAIADRIVGRRASVRVVLIAGPSASGKTTFAKRLAIQLRVLGRNPVPISLDDYFVDREHTPRDEHGEPDFESIDALDVPLLNQHLVQLLEGGAVEKPSFDFHTGGRRPRGTRLELPDRGLLILEGIHGLNDRLTHLVPREAKFKIYVSALTQLNLDDHHRISTTDNRLVRRMVRDYRYRGHSALMTLQMWPSVRRGEDRNIFPFQNTADAAFNSALDYELAVLKIAAEPLLASVGPEEPEYQDARGLLAFLANFVPLGSEDVPPHSILREFIGGSTFNY
jgi:uridine kinase